MKQGLNKIENPFQTVMSQFEHTHTVLMKFNIFDREFHSQGPKTVFSRHHHQLLVLLCPFSNIQLDLSKEIIIHLYVGVDTPTPPYMGI